VAEIDLAGQRAIAAAEAASKLKVPQEKAARQFSVSTGYVSEARALVERDAPEAGIPLIAGSARSALFPNSTAACTVSLRPRRPIPARSDPTPYLGSHRLWRAF
jgi:hypothetical protein